MYAEVETITHGTTVRTWCHIQIGISFRPDNALFMAGSGVCRIEATDVCRCLSMGGSNTPGRFISVTYLAVIKSHGG